MYSTCVYANLLNGPTIYRKLGNANIARTYIGVKPVIQPIRAKNRKKFLSLCCIVTNTEWNGIIKLIIEVKCIRIILSPNLIDIVVF